MLVLKRYEGQTIKLTDMFFGDEITIQTFEMGYGNAKLGIECPEYFAVTRNESLDHVIERRREIVAQRITEDMAHRATSNDLRTFGSIVVELRTTAGLSTTVLAGRLGVSQSTLSRIESGNREPRLEIIRMLCEALPGLNARITAYLIKGSF